MPTLTRDGAQAWITRWDRQQEGYVPHREDRFAVLLDAVQAAVRRPDPLVLDLGCGPGSLAVRLLERMPEATVVALDADPLLLTLGRAAYRDTSGLRFAEADLGTAGWATALRLDRAVDIAVSTTALHWLPEPRLQTAYRELAAVLRPGGVLLNGDDFTVAETSPTLATLERELQNQAVDRHLARHSPEDWRQWWDAVTADPALTDVLAAREQRRSEGHDGAESSQLATHVRALESAGFTEIGTLWQHGDNRLLCAVKSAT